VRGDRIVYSAAEMQWLESNRMMVISDYHRAFCAAFDRAEVTAMQLHGLRKRKGWKVGRAPERFAGRHRHLKFSPDEISWLRDNCTMPIGDYHAGFCARFDRADMWAEQLQALRKREGWRTGRSGRFEQGQESHNKGKRCAEGTGGRHPNARKTQFKAGQLPHNTQGPGHVSLGDDGYLWIVTDRRNPWTGASTWRVHLHRWQWEQKHGPVPKGQVLKCRDGNRQNADPANWEAVPRGVLSRLNGGPRKRRIAYDAAPAELKPTLMAVAKLEQGIHDRRKATA